MTKSSKHFHMLVSVLFILMAVEATAQQKSIQFASQPVWSPDSRQIAFMGNITGDYEVYIVNRDGTKLRRITNNPAVDWMPAFTPDGKSLVFSSDRDGDYELYLVSLETGETNQLTYFDKTREDRPGFTPDGRFVHFNSTRGTKQGGNDCDIFLMSLDYPLIMPVTYNTACDSYPAWSSDGAYFLFGSNQDGPWELYKALSNGAGVEKVKSSRDHSTANYPTLSPDGKHFIYQYVTERNSDLFLVNAKDLTEQNLTNTPELYEIHPAWSPDGMYIAFVVRNTESSGPGDLYLMSPDGTNRRRIDLFQEQRPR